MLPPSGQLPAIVTLLPICGACIVMLYWSVVLSRKMALIVERGSDGDAVKRKP